uniref:Succinate dehydrogenase cytochrome b556 subunit n=1 Tax=uncultured Thiotrichaceae bacterium TaxID=298394 RepID=A0A6S6S317_9GAMM|nr:MAG: Succinate dehydrogenase cytochrome b-556 subunit [uncultured Thiotrichaceae bacterium]
MIKPHRNQPLWYAFILHRLSGVALAIFLPVHFYILGLALSEPESLDSMLLWTENPLVKFAEFGLVFLLAVHLFGGIRLLAVEFLPWNPGQKTFAAAAVALAFFVALIFLLQAI